MKPSRIAPVALFVALLSLGCSGEQPGARAEEAWKRLAAGNARYSGAKASHPQQDAERRSEVATGQHPVAAVLGCADSRVPPELLFDQGIGDLFVVRVAGNTADDAVLGSLEYAVEHLGVPLIVVLGHERCGAVQATVKGGEAPGHLGSLLRPIGPAVAQARALPGDLVENSVAANARAVAAKIRGAAPILANAVQKGELKVMAVRYDLDTGAVSALE